MTYIPKPKVHHPDLPKNSLGLTNRDYEGSLSSLCAGCGHDSVTAAIVEACWELAIAPHSVAKLSGIGCSSKTPAYFLSAGHGFNSVHGRMPSVATGAYCAASDLIYLGVSGDGDTASIGLGQFAHAIRRRLRMLYICENNGVYGLTKGQFSATADLASLSKKGDHTLFDPIDPALFAIQMGATFVAKSFSGDKAQLVPLIKAGLMHPGFAVIDIVSPCVTFNNHEGSTKSYKYTREHEDMAIELVDFIPPRQEISVTYPEGETESVTLHDGSVMKLRKIDKTYDPHDRIAAAEYYQRRRQKGEVLTGILYMDPNAVDYHKISNTDDRPLRSIPHKELCPGAAALSKINGMAK